MSQLPSITPSPIVPRHKSNSTKSSAIVISSPTFHNNINNHKRTFHETTTTSTSTANINQNPPLSSTLLSFDEDTHETIEDDYEDAADNVNGTTTNKMVMMPSMKKQKLVQFHDEISTATSDLDEVEEKQAQSTNNDDEIEEIDDEDAMMVGSGVFPSTQATQIAKNRVSPNDDDIDLDDGKTQQDLDPDVQEVQNGDVNSMKIAPQQPQGTQSLANEGVDNQVMLNYFEDFNLELDSSGRVYFEVEICHQTPSVANEVSFEIGICNSNEELIGMNNCGQVQLNMESVMDIGIGMLKEGDVVGVLFSFGTVFFTHNGKRIAHGFEWKDIQNSTGKIVCRNDSQKFCIKNNNFLFSGYKKAKEDTMKTPFTEIIQKITQLEMDYLVKEKENREMKLFHNDLSARMTLSDDEISHLSELEIYDLQTVLLQSMTLLNQALKNRK